MKEDTLIVHDRDEDEDRAIDAVIQFIVFVMARGWKSAIRVTQHTWRATVPRRQRQARVKAAFAGDAEDPKSGHITAYEVVGIHRFGRHIVDVFVELEGQRAAAGRWRIRTVAETSAYCASLDGVFGVNVTSIRRTTPEDPF